METLKHILDLTYELEGLVELALRRVDTQVSLIPLISDKIASIDRVAANLKAARPTPPPPSAPPAPPVIAPESSATSYEILEDLLATSTEMSEPILPVTEPVMVAPPIGQLPFSINDKFRFRRELFGNDNTRYTRALDIIATMTSLDEVRDYLCNDLELDEDASEVQAFLERVRTLASL